jgi:putative FmdB family regulatory protein
MATYIYKCNDESCEVNKEYYEVRQSMKDDALKSCPKCWEDTLSRVITGGTHFQLKGKGWTGKLGHR